ncbi:hypothetical protein PYCCODRAFT_1429787 [Trametes coccinea BRFM310]|uniref:Uncharacterized protein n=1 Tax=Trametes coccinea (strain BRFM310) TaxID=1353009 RepID=A0A1Y2J8B6_TRAC3|nr:hypothetical protein PYCCODRAFT_1429787 [Trametes coccinea BRFM310]
MSIFGYAISSYPLSFLSSDRARVCVSMASCNHELFPLLFGYRTRCGDELPLMFYVGAAIVLSFAIYTSARLYISLYYC